MNILVFNCGSSSLKFQLLAVSKESLKQDTEAFLAKGVIERIGSQALITLCAGDKIEKRALPIKNHRHAIEYIVQWIIGEDNDIDSIHSISDIHAAGHRVVHGGEQFKSSVIINDQVLKGIADCIDLAPLHNQANLSGIKAVSEIFGTGMPQVAVFDTSFHTTMPEENYIYPIPYQFYRRHKVRRYGFHGTSHRYISYRYRKIANIQKEKVNIITLHLGNGSSACAIKSGISYATSMGMTPLEGLCMGTRSGDIDPSIPHFLHLKEGMSYDSVYDMLNSHSGLLGISGLTHDMRELIAEHKEHNDRRAKLAIDVFCANVRKYIGAYIAVLNGIDALVFSGGIGENSAYIRELICNNLDFLGITIDQTKNIDTVNGKEGLISKKDGKIGVYAIPTNEELLIARDTFRCIEPS